jgi:hypothetical protein
LGYVDRENWSVDKDERNEIKIHDRREKKTMIGSAKRGKDKQKHRLR